MLGNNTIPIRSGHGTQRHLSNKERFRAHFNKAAEIPQNHSITWPRFYIERCLHPGPGDRILDLGAYIGNNLILFGCRGFDIDGIEVGQKYVETFHRRINGDFPKSDTLAARVTPEAKSRMHMYCGMIEDFEADQWYECVMCTEVLEHVIDAQAIIKKAYSLLAPGGLFFCTVPKARQRTDVRHYSPEALFVAMVNGGFPRENIEIEECVPDKSAAEWGVTQLVCKARKGAQ